MNKRFIILSLCLIAVFSLCGCRSKKDDNSAQVTPAPTSSSAGSNYDGDYHANNNGNVDDNDSVTDSKPDYGTNNNTSAPNATNNGTSAPSTNDSGASGNRVMDEVGNAVDDLVNDAKNAMRRGQE